MTSGGQLLVVNGHPVLREGLLAMVDREPDITVCGVAADGEAAVEAIEEHDPRVVLVDVSTSDSKGVDIAHLILREHPDVRILCFALHADRYQLAALLEAGAAGYVLWSAEAGEVLMAIRAVADGQTYLSPTVTGDLVRDFVIHRPRGSTDEPHLTRREYEVLQLIAEGLGTGEVAARTVDQPQDGQHPPRAHHGQAGPPHGRRPLPIRHPHGHGHRGPRPHLIRPGPPRAGTQIAPEALSPGLRPMVLTTVGHRCDRG